MNTFKKPDPQAKALWRYGIIAPLLHHSDDDPGLLQMLQQLASKTFIRPDGATIRLSAERPCENGSIDIAKAVLPIFPINRAVIKDGST